MLEKEEVGARTERLTGVKRCDGRAVALVRGVRAVKRVNGRWVASPCDGSYEARQRSAPQPSQLGNSLLAGPAMREGQRAASHTHAKTTHTSTRYSGRTEGASSNLASYL